MALTIIITGASKGIGKAIAMKLAEHKTNLVLVARSNDELAKLKNEIEALGSLCLPISIDLALKGSLQRIITTAAETFGNIDVLINNAGLAMSLPIQETSEEDWNKIMNLNVRVPFFLSKAAIP